MSYTRLNACLAGALIAVTLCCAPCAWADESPEKADAIEISANMQATEELEGASDEDSNDAAADETAGGDGGTAGGDGAIGNSDLDSPIQGGVAESGDLASGNSSTTPSTDAAADGSSTENGDSAQADSATSDGETSSPEIGGSENEATGDSPELEGEASDAPGSPIDDADDAEDAAADVPAISEDKRASSDGKGSAADEDEIAAPGDKEIASGETSLEPVDETPASGGEEASSGSEKPATSVQPAAVQPSSGDVQQAGKTSPSTPRNEGAQGASADKADAAQENPTGSQSLPSGVSKVKATDSPAAQKADTSASSTATEQPKTAVEDTASKTSDSQKETSVKATGSKVTGTDAFGAKALTSTGTSAGAKTAAGSTAGSGTSKSSGTSGSQLSASGSGKGTGSSTSSKLSKPTANVSIGIYAGDTMYETAVAEAMAAFPKGSDSAVIAGPGGAWVDALSASALAAAKGPILFSELDSLHDATSKALKDLGVKSVIIVGGPKAVGKGVVTDLGKLGIALEARLAGNDCYGTQMAIYDYGIEQGLWSGDAVMIATSGWFGDALSASPVSYAERMPIFLVDEDGSFNSAQKKALEKTANSIGLKEVVITGGNAVVSEETEAYLNNLVGDKGSVVRLGGADQYETSRLIAAWSVEQKSFTWNNVALTTGNAPYDALAGSVLQGGSKSVMVLADSPDEITIRALGANKSAVKGIRIFGGKRALTSDVRYGIASQLGFPFAAFPDFRLYLDAGHGYNDLGNGKYATGAEGNGYQEATLTRELVNKVAKILREECGLNVFANIDGGPYWERHAEAVEEGCDAILSIHFNAAGGTGTESLRHNYNAAESSDEWQAQIHQCLIEGVRLTDRGMKEQEVAILGGILPATLLEICFIDNKDDITWYQARKDTVARKIAEGVIK
ncbi:MAG: cell wall-binding repeat-containing protein [Eggerthellaceae bacterium]|nr:cell wall-binding repeat-containing protein [Eggerthellaceae bacterium]